MSSPIAKKNKGIIDRLLIDFHKKHSHTNRVEQLSSIFYKEINKLNTNSESINFLDVGCGDMKISQLLSDKIRDCNYICIDIYPNINGWENYFEFNGVDIPFADNSFDFIIFSDVLHHDLDNMELLLNEAKRVAKFIIIKDHFEYDFLSRKILQIADFIGNYGYGVSIPKRYLSHSTYQDLFASLELNELTRVWPIDLYSNSSITKLIMKPKFQFVSVLTSNL